MPETTKISVIMPVHNGMPHLPKAVESLLLQSFADFEILAVDDGSTDDSPQYLKSLEDHRVAYHRLERVGLVEALNYGLERAQSPLIARMDCDDIACPNRLGKQYVVFTREANLVLLGCRFEFIDADDRPLPDDGDLFFTGDAALRWMLMFGCPFLHPGVMYQREAAIAAGCYRKEYYLAEDYDLWTRLSIKGKLRNHPEILMKKRRHEGSVSAQNRIRQNQVSATIAAQHGHRLVPSVAEHVIEQIHRLLCRDRSVTIRDLNELEAGFQALVDRFAAPGEVDSELSRGIACVRRQLRWRCSERAREQITRPWRAWCWLKAAAALDGQEIGGVWGLVSSRILGRLWAPA